MQRSGGASKVDTGTRAAINRRARLRLDLQVLENKANTMNASTQALMHVINSLRRGWETQQYSTSAQMASHCNAKHHLSNKTISRVLLKCLFL